jgi:hypothetical protein
MLKKSITFEDYNGVTITEDFFFNLTKSELVELEVSEKEGFAEALKAIVAAADGAVIIAKFKAIILLAYGIKSEDGRRFIKSDALREEFSQTEAYSQLFIELCTDAEAASRFIKGIVPSGLSLSTAPDALGNVSITAPLPADTSLESMSREELLKALAEKTPPTE